MIAAGGAQKALRRHLERIRSRAELGGPPALHRAPLALERLLAPPPCPRLRAAEAELLEVHRIELAWLARSAARLRMAEDPAGTHMLRALGEEPPPLETWRAGLLDALRCAAADGLRCPRSLAATFARCAGAAPEAWDEALHLAEAALRLEPCAEGRLTLALALCTHGRPDGAAAVLAAELLGPVRASAAVQRRVLAALGYCERNSSGARGDTLARLVRAAREERP